MRKSLLILAALTVFVIIIASQALAVPKMFLPEEKFDFGYTPQQVKVSHTFWIKSVGEDTLKILKIRPGWGCTKAPLSKKELAVGDSTDLEIIFSTGRRRGATSKSPSIQTNEGPPKRRVVIRATVVQEPDSTYPITLKPYKLYVSRAGEVEVDHATFEITNVSDEDLTPTLVGAPPGYFQVELPEVVKAGQTAQGKLTVNADYLGAPFEKSITLELSDTAESRFTIPVIRRLIGPQKVQKTQQQGSTATKTSGGH